MFICSNLYGLVCCTDKVWGFNVDGMRESCVCVSCSSNIAIMITRHTLSDKHTLMLLLLCVCTH